MLLEVKESLSLMGDKFEQVLVLNLEFHYYYFVSESLFMEASVQSEMSEG